MKKAFFAILVIILLIVMICVPQKEEEQTFEYEGTAILAAEINRFNSDRLEIYEIYEIGENSECLFITLYYNFEGENEQYRLADLYNLRNYILEIIKQNNGKFNWCKHISMSCFSTVDKDSNIPCAYISFYGSPHSVDSMEINSWCYPTEFENMSLDITELRVNTEFTFGFDISMLKCFPQLKKLYMEIPIDDISQIYEYIPDDCEVEIVNQIHCK